MFDIQHDSAVPIHEQIVSQIMAHVASGALKPGASLWEYRALAQELLTHPQVVARAYADLEWAGVIEKARGGDLEVSASAAYICRLQLQDRARRAIRQAVARGVAAGLGEEEIRQALEEALKTPIPTADISQAIKNPAHETSHRASQGIQILSRQAGSGPPQPQRAAGSDIRPAR